MNFEGFIIKYKIFIIRKNDINNKQALLYKDKEVNNL